MARPVPARPAPDPLAAFLGVGWAFPVAAAADGAVATAAHDEDVRQAIRILLGTNTGERQMRPGFGAGLRDYVFAPMSVTTLARVKKRVADSLTDEEPRIDVLAVDVTPDPARGRLVIDIGYRVRATNTRTNLVYPFYLEEGAAG